MLHASESTSIVQTWIFYSTYNLTHLGRDKFIYGLLINQSLGGLLCEYLSVQTAHIRNTIQSIAKFLPLFKPPGHSFVWAPCVWISLMWDQIMAENYLNSYFNILQPGEYVAGFAVEHALTKHYHKGLKRGATRNTLVRLSCALERLFINYLLQFNFFSTSSS